MELAKARQKGFVSKHSSDGSGTHTKKKILAVIGIITRFGRKNNRDAIRKAWMPTGRISILFVCFNAIPSTVYGNMINATELGTRNPVV